MPSSGRSDRSDRSEKVDRFSVGANKQQRGNHISATVKVGNHTANLVLGIDDIYANASTITHLDIEQALQTLASVITINHKITDPNDLVAMLRSLQISMDRRFANQDKPLTEV